MALIANNLYTLDVHAPKKAAVISVGIAAPAAKVVSVHIGSAVAVNKQVSLDSTIEQCLRLALSELPALVVAVTCTVGGTPVLDGTPGTGDVTLSVGATVVAQQQSGFIVRTTKRLREYITEDA
jgi:hypothetical protein